VRARSRAAVVACVVAGVFAALTMGALAPRSAEAASAAGALFGQTDNDRIVAEGWAGFADLALLLDLALSLGLAVALAFVIGYHPARRLRARRIEEVEAPRVNVVYATVGAIIGTLVAHYGLVVGLVVFGIGGLMRFRTNLVSAGATGRVIISTLVGLCCGMQLPHVAVVATIFSFVLLFLLERRLICRLVVKGLGPDTLAASADAYRAALEAQRCELVSEEKNFLKGQVAFIFFAASRADSDQLTARIEAAVQGELQGALDWEVS
jgi:uncharacterized membrane protein YhiD involved in acid resistance